MACVLLFAGDVALIDVMLIYSIAKGVDFVGAPQTSSQLSLTSHLSYEANSNCIVLLTQTSHTLETYVHCALYDNNTM